ncbi:MAG: hypothetical protein KJ729_01200 [Euryarchaeota archaeon]|nr:hypothetical protein [Euryarchaeota archaeon]
MTDNENNKLILFQNKSIRRTWFKEDWYFSIVDIVGALTDSINPRDYWYKTKIRLGEEEKAELSTICLQLKLEAPDGKLRTTDCAVKRKTLR